MKIEFQDQIDKYVLGRMGDTERAIFEKEVAKNAELQEQLQFTQDVISATKSRVEKLSKIKDWKDDYIFEDEGIVDASNYLPTGSGYDACPSTSIEQKSKKSYFSLSGKLYWLSGIAAIFVVGFFIFNILLDRNVEIKYSPSNIDYSITRGGDNYIKIEQLLSKGNYQEAMKEIAREESAVAKQKIVTDSIADDEQREYEIKVYTIDMEILCWLKINALIGLGKHNDALLLLNKLRKEDGVFKEKADSLYHIIK